jgi:uncharacterized membrane protein YkoI
MMMKRSKLLLGAGVFVAVVVAALGIAVATGAAGDDDKPLTGDTYDRATAAALDHTGGGTVTETEVGDDGAAYSVEVRLADGRQVEVNLDAAFKVIGSEADDDGPGDEDEGDDD